MRLTVLGLTFSGHPTRTTFGNTLRMTVRVFFLLVCVAGIHHFVLVVGGDDIVIWVPESKEK